MTKPLLTLENVSRSYGDFYALKDISLEVQAGEFIAITGPSGCGKSTLLNLLGCIDRPNTGQLKINGKDTTGLNDPQLTTLRRTQLGYVFQFFNLLPTLTIAENIGLPLAIDGRTPSKEIHDEVSRWATKVGLSHRLANFPATLSGGEMQRAAIARALIHKPALILADEPTGNLDSENGDTVLKLMTQLNRENGQTFIMATHSPEAAAIATRHIRMQDGRILSDTGCAS